MKLIAEEVIERIKRESDIIAVARKYDLEPKRQGKNWLAQCVFHPDTEASLCFSRNLFHCFGCEAAGSVIDLVMKMEGKGFREAVEQLQAEFGTAGSDTIINQSPAPSDDGVLRMAYTDFCHGILLHNEVGKGYLKKRGLLSQELIERLKLGYANRSYCFTLPNGKAGLELRRQLQASGILRESGHEHMSGSITVPFFDRDGKVVQIGCEPKKSESRSDR